MIFRDSQAVTFKTLLAEKYLKPLPGIELRFFVHPAITYKYLMVKRLTSLHETVFII